MAAIVETTRIATRTCIQASREPDTPPYICMAGAQTANSTERIAITIITVPSRHRRNRMGAPLGRLHQPSSAPGLLRADGRRGCPPRSRVYSPDPGKSHDNRLGRLVLERAESGDPGPVELVNGAEA